QELAIVGDLSSDETRRVLRAGRAAFRPHKVVALKPAVGGERAEEAVPLLAGKSADGPGGLYVCENFTCEARGAGGGGAGAALQWVGGSAGPRTARPGPTPPGVPRRVAASRSSAARASRDSRASATPLASASSTARASFVPTRSST